MITWSGERHDTPSDERSQPMPSLLTPVSVYAHPLSVFSVNLSSFGAHRCDLLHRAGVINRVFVYLGPQNASAVANKAEWAQFRAVTACPLWCWWVCSPDLTIDAAQIIDTCNRLRCDGILLNIEKPLEGVPLGPLLTPLEALGLPMIASLAGTSPAHTPYDYRALDRHKIPIDWQCYLDSGEGPAPDVAVKEAFTPSFVCDQHEYRHRNGARYAWGRAWPDNLGNIIYDAYPQPGSANYTIDTPGLGGTHLLRSRTLQPTRSGANPATLYGRAPYAQIRVTLDTTRGADTTRTPAEWAALANTARIPGAARRPTSVYLAETTRSETLVALAL